MRCEWVCEMGFALKVLEEGKACHTISLFLFLNYNNLNQELRNARGEICDIIVNYAYEIL